MLIFKFRIFNFSLCSNQFYFGLAFVHFVVLSLLQSFRQRHAKLYDTHDVVLVVIGEEELDRHNGCVGRMTCTSSAR